MGQVQAHKVHLKAQGILSTPKLLGDTNILSRFQLQEHQVICFHKCTRSIKREFEDQVSEIESHCINSIQNQYQHEFNSTKYVSLKILCKQSFRDVWSIFLNS